MSKPEVLVRDNPAAYRFEVALEGGAVAIAEYRLSDGLIVFTHTEVPPAFEGRGIGGALIRAGLQAARARGLKVQPDCPFFAAYIEKHPAEQDLLSPAARAKMGL